MVLIFLSLFLQLTETIDVKVTNVDVVVTDKSGKPVRNLTRDDFTILEDGKLQPVTNFYEVQPEAPAGAAPAPADANKNVEPPRPRRIVIFIDNYSLHPFRRHEVFAAIDRSFNELFRPGDQAMVAAWNRGLHIVIPFTGDREKLRAAMRRYEKDAGGGAPIEFEREHVMANIAQVLQAEFDARGGNNEREAIAHAESLARSYAQSVSMNEKALVKAMSTTLTTLAGLEGKKVMLVAGQQLPSRPGLEVFQYVDQLFSGRGVSNAQRGAFTWDITADLEKLARQANANDVTMYMIDGGDALRSISQTAESASVLNRSMEFTDLANTAQSLNTIARITGGMALVRTNNFDVALSTMANDLAAYYSLGYRPSSDTAGDHRIEVKVKNSDYRVRARTTYVAKSTKEQAEDRVIANAFHGLVPSDFAVKLDAERPAKHSETKWKVPIRITFPSDITLLPNGNDLEGSFTVILLVVDDDGTMSTVTRRQQPVKLPKAALPAMRKNPISFTAEMLVSPGAHYISVGIIDDVANTAGFARARVNAG
ncbi:MAG TPA: VWA domain-containing protein [Thermoanaerobaculia bacterium]|nr:VWA domain-containing protein [Thermoanaerobaculia bacterium]